ncbi:MAG TPA: hypothetical protein VK206_07795, partial [Anaerolineales bacterium]|nr:hypothetical protein [Anaerolineales bacterium]
LELIAFVYTIIVFARITEVFIARPSTISQTEAIIFVNVFWVAIILMTPAIYNYGATFVFKKKHGSIWRIIFATVIFTTIVIMLLFPNYELHLLNLESNSTTISSTLYHYIGSWQSITLTAFVTVVILVPSLIYITLLFVDVVLWLIWAGGSVWTYFMLFHRTHPMQKIQKLIYEEIHRKDDEKTSWKLIECDMKEIDSIQAWAEANREGTEKRLLPTIIFFSLIQLFGWNAISNTVVWQRIIEVWDKFIALMLGNGLSSLGIAVSVVVGCVLAIVLAPFIAIGQLFSNILPQSLIIEACIVAKYVREKELKSTPLFDVNSKIPSRFIDRLAYLLGYVPREKQSPDRTR